MEKTTVQIFQYRDYRVYLKDWYLEAKKTQRGFSYRAFSKKAGLTSPNFLQLVMEGKRNLSTSGIVKFAIGLGLNKQETDFFKSLVHLNQAKNFNEKVAHETRLMKSRKLATLSPIEFNQFQLFSSWHHPVIIELVTSRQFDGTPEWLAEKIHPQVSVIECRRSLFLLERLGFVKRVGENSWQRVTSVITTGAEPSENIMIDYHQQLLMLTHDVLPNIPQRQRDVSALTIGITRRRLQELKKRVQEFRQDIIHEFSTNLPTEDVVLLNIQLIPVTSVVRQE